MPFDDGQIGPVYDVGISVRDDQPLSVKNRDGKTVQVTQVAFMSSPQGQQDEGTDLQRKDQLVRLSSANTIDREFTNYPQTSQGSWVDGEGQRIYADTSKYWSGNGLIWPLSAFHPSSSYLQPVVTDGATSGNPSPVQGIVGGSVAGKIGQAIIYRNGANTPFLAFTSTIDGSRTTDTSANFATAVDFCVIADRIFYVLPGAAGGANPIYQIFASDGSTSTAALGSGANDATKGVQAIYGGMLGGNSYLAVVYNGSDLRQKVDFWSVSTAPAYGLTGPSTTTLPAGVSVRAQDVVFQGDAIIISCRVGSDNIILSSTTANVVTTLARLSGYSSVFLSSVEGALVLLASNGTPNYQMDLYILSGGALNFLVTVPQAYGQVPSQVSKMSQWGPYALFTASYTYTTGTFPYPIGTANQNPLVLYALDVTRQALFTVERLMGPATGTLRQVTAVAAQRLVAGGSLPYLTFGWVAAVWTGEGTYQYAGFGPAIRYPVGLGGTTGQVIDTPGSVVSSLIDFTQASVKLYRQVVVDHNPIPPQDVNASVRLSAWLDALPDQLGGVEQLQTINTEPGSKRTVLQVNRTAKKLVYEVDYESSVVGLSQPSVSAFGGAVPGLPTTQPGLIVLGTIATGVNQPAALLSKPAPRPIAVSVQAATGWVWQLKLDLARKSRVNGQSAGDFCFQRQGLDEVVAYNFLRQLWRERGGECVLSLANQDEYPAVIESEHFLSPKPYTVSTDGATPDKYETQAELAIREDA